MKIFFAAVLVAILPALGFSFEMPARQFQIEAKIYMDNKLISSPKIVTLDGLKAEVSVISENQSSTLKLEVTPTSLETPHSDHELDLHVVLEHKLGTKLLRSSSTVETSLDREVSLTIESESSKRSVKVVLRTIAL